MAEDTAPAVTTPAPAPAPTVKKVLEFSGKPGMAFGIRGQGFGESGTLTISGQVIQATRWTDTDIRGVLPDVLPPGDVIVTSGEKVQKLKFKG